MDRRLLQILADPCSGRSLELCCPDDGGSRSVSTGELRGERGRSYPVRNGIPRFVAIDDADQLQTQRSFGYKWRQRQTYDSPQMLDAHRRWVTERYGFDGADGMRRWFASRERILDAGCGSGFSSSTWLDESWRDCGNAEWVGLDISEAIDVARDRLGHIAGTHFVQGDVLAPPFAAGAFDTIFSEGVLHHTPSTRQGVRALSRLLSDGGRLMFYVYRRKGPIREFTDDYVRAAVADAPEEEAWEMLKPLTELGRVLAESAAEVDVPCDIPLLGIQAGRQPVQRLIYWNMAKLFWNPELTFEENHHVNFDWYHPRYAHRHTEREIRGWCDECGLNIERFCEQESGYTVVASNR